MFSCVLGQLGKLEKSNPLTLLINHDVFFFSNTEQFQGVSRNLS